VGRHRAGAMGPTARYHVRFWYKADTLLASRNARFREKAVITDTTPRANDPPFSYH